VEVNGDASECLAAEVPADDLLADGQRDGARHN
jgi:hypothetical protein